MKTEDFDYYLPQDLIAYEPVRKRDSSNLMILRKKDRAIDHGKFYDIKEYLKDGDLLILNNTKVIPSRIEGRAIDGKLYELLLTEKTEKSDQNIWECLVKNPRDGLIIKFKNGVCGKLERTDKTQWAIDFNQRVDGYLDDHGMMPLPPYIQRAPRAGDRETYQTVYAKIKGAVAAPTAGLHFTKELLDSISYMGVEISFITLHVGIGTFRPVKSEFITEHTMHPEFVYIDEHTAKHVNNARDKGGRVIAVGTTVVRALESSLDEKGNLVPYSGHTNIYIYPGFNFRIVDSMVTNFHLPRSTLLMLVSAFTGKEFILRAYAEAVKRRYRMLSYGDAMFIT